MNFKHWIKGVGAVALLATGLVVMAQEVVPPKTPDKPVVAGKKATSTQQKATSAATSQTRSKSNEIVTMLPPIVVTAKMPDGFSSIEQSTSPIKDELQLPNTTHSTDLAHIHETVNIVDPEDAVKYFPSLFLRKRNNGDPQSVLETRTWGVNSSARSLVYADDILLSALIGNNNTNAAPRWGLISPEEISRVDFLYGPFSAAYPGNSEGGVLLFTTKMPDKLIVDGTQTEAFQTFDLYKTKDTYRTDETNIVIGNKNGNVSWLVNGSYENNYSQPLYFVTNATKPAGTSGAISDVNKLGAPANVVGAGGILHAQYVNLNGKLAWDITPTMKATFDSGFYLNDSNSTVQSYLQNTATGNQTFAGISGFASDNYNLSEEHLANSFSLKTNTQDVFDWDLSVSNYYYLDDVQKNPLSPSATTTGFSANGTITSFTGTNWQNGDLKGILRPNGPDGEHEISFGLHADRYDLDNPTYATSDWTSGTDATGTEYSDGEGTTYTEALWAQDAWRFVNDWKLTFGGRLENWQAEDGFNLATTRSGAGVITGSSATNQPDQDALRFSPKVSLDWTPSKEWEVTGSFGEAYRFPTVSELYQTVTSGPTIVVPNPNLRPEDDFSTELALERHFDDGNIRLSVFNDYVKNALISQTNFIGGTTPLTFTTNVAEIRNTGVELDAQKDNVFVHGLDFFGNVTYVNSEILSDPSFASTTGTTADGKKVPYVPEWRATFGTTFHPIDNLALTAALRYSGKQYSTLDNSDTTNGVFGAFDSFLVVDLHAQYKINDNLFVDAGIDNVNDEKYFLYHPFPQRTFTASVRVQF
jgi:iron complex outermembrane receptor protein